MGPMLHLFGVGMCCAAFAYLLHSVLVLGHYVSNRHDSVVIGILWAVLFYLTTQVTWFRASSDTESSDTESSTTDEQNSRKARTRRRAGVQGTLQESAPPALGGQLPRPLSRSAICEGPRSYNIEGSPRMSPQTHNSL